ncbi:CDP-diacylglycerol--glycerol-3-phosphate 3-phosphatidyltransferase [Thermogymnomonas acidicola]|uniref:CDP-diacylglycerol--glycerol-3-phosphate 3-phosphatidyltransferase n=1 Tax=Thermogymnomonas acidicola TaxID=399579 RepID=A0AA37BR78_9ARCH|nr:CDP-alcohol phosphatidyltransferase family protein [Thermogymnomonas acidicola]GGM73590.1 CDP-diacylglycerol--glycerol-3-phosphate 3-phosphatidyltransferase [Thermogymnomonas acidicola]
MALDTYRPKADRFIEPIARAFYRASPSQLTVSSLALSGIAGACYYLSLRPYLIASLVAVALASLFDALDGKLARMKGVASKRGDLLDHVIDRFSDIFILAGLAFSTLGNVALGLFGMEGVLMTSYMGTQSQALGLGRNYSGIMGRADRLVLIIVVTVVEIVYPVRYAWYFQITPVTVLLLAFGVLGNYTAVKRFSDAWRSLG